MENDKDLQWKLRKKQRKEKERQRLINWGSEDKAIEEGLKISKRSKFCYFLISSRTMKQGSYTNEYQGYPDPSSQFCVLTKPNVKEEDTGWKIHISVDPSQIPKAWDLIVETLMQYGIHTAKVLKPDQSQPEYQAGKEITLYSQSNPLNWQNLLHDITNIYVANGIYPNYKAIHDKQIDNSVYFSCRTDHTKSGEKLSSLEVDSHNESGEHHLFEDLKIENDLLNKSQPEQPTRTTEQEHQIIEFYRWHQEVCSVMLHSLQQTFPLVDSSIHKLPDGSFFAELIRQYNELFGLIHTSEDNNKMWDAKYSLLDFIKDIQMILSQNYNIGNVNSEDITHIKIYVKEQLERIDRTLSTISTSAQNYLKFVRAKVDSDLDLSTHDMLSLNDFQYKNIYNILCKGDEKYNIKYALNHRVAECLTKALMSKEIKLADIRDITPKHLSILEKRFINTEELNVKVIINYAGRIKEALNENLDKENKEQHNRNLVDVEKEDKNTNNSLGKNRSY